MTSLWVHLLRTYCQSNSLTPDTVLDVYQTPPKEGDASPDPTCARTNLRSARCSGSPLPPKNRLHLRLKRWPFFSRSWPTGPLVLQSLQQVGPLVLLLGLRPTVGERRSYHRRSCGRTVRPVRCVGCLCLGGFIEQKSPSKKCSPTRTNWTLVLDLE